VFGNISEFHRAVHLITERVSFDQDTTVQVFEATIRVLGGLLSAHLLLNDPHVFPSARLPGYDNELLDLAADLAVRLSGAFDGTATGLPHPRINLRHGVQPDMEKIHETCLAGAGSLLLELGLISHLTGDPMYGKMAQKSVLNLWERRNEKTGLLGNTIDIRTGVW
ncbi:putative ER degradation-enhancing alpha-mannosidase-like protein 1, partial [Hypsibius exemplaris]